jgi:hypothetical protein
VLQMVLFVLMHCEEKHLWGPRREGRLVLGALRDGPRAARRVAAGTNPDVKNQRSGSPRLAQKV